MHFTKQQKKIIKTIVDGKVYDIYSYLHEFGKLKTARYDLELYREQFKDDQKNKKYKVIVKPELCYSQGNSVVDIGSIGSHVIRTSLQKPEDQIPDEAWEWQPAKLTEQIEETSYEYRGEKYTFDFVNGVQIATDFNDIIDFLTLWTYLREEKLILETPETITPEILGCFFEERKKEPKRDNAYELNKYGSVERGKDGITPVYHTTFGRILPGDLLDAAPLAKITDYFDVEWKINEEHLMNCQDFIGRKILPNSGLRLFAKRFYKTTEEWHYIVPLAVSFIALAISLFQLFAPSGEEKQLREISSKIEQIEMEINQHNDNLKDDLDNLNKSSKDASSNTDGIYKEISEIKDEIDQILDDLGVSDEMQQ